MHIIKVRKYYGDSLCCFQHTFTIKLDNKYKKITEHYQNLAIYRV